MAITAADVAKLRKMTGAGMMDCKKALGEADGDFDGAIEILRKQGQKLASKREDRDAKEGVVLSGVSADGKTGAIVVFNCETDFVAKNEDFIAFTKELLDLTLENKPADVAALGALEIKGLKVSDHVTEKIGAIGEKLEIGYCGTLDAEQVFAYIHPGNKLATIVGFNKGGVEEQMGKDVAMQVAAMSPVSVDKDDCPTDIIEKEIEIGKDQARQEGKPEEMLEKIAMGKLNKFYKEQTLLNQEFVKEAKTTIKQYITKADKDLTVTGFKRFSLS